MAAKLWEILNPAEMKVQRPIKRVDVRVTGLDDTTTAEEVVSAVAFDGGCPADQIRAGALSSFGAVRLSCPIIAAKVLQMF